MAIEAHIFQINRSDGGVPKGPIREGQVTSLGLEGDRHNDTVHHGGPERALCLYSDEVTGAARAPQLVYVTGWLQDIEDRLESGR